MKRFFTLCLLGSALAAAAQTKQLTNATITTVTVITAADTEEPPSPIPAPSGEGQVVIRRTLGDAGETSSTTYYKNNMVKTVVENDFGRTTTIRDNAAKKTTTLMEIMGNKRGFYATDDEMADMRRRMDSLTQISGEGQSAGAVMAAMPVPADGIVPAEGSKQVAGYNCKKALLLSTRAGGKTDTTTVWYTNEIKMEGLTHTGGPGGGFMSLRSNQQHFDKLDGFAMEYETSLSRGRKMTVTVKKIDTEKEIKDKEFEISKDFELKPMKDMQGSDGRMQIRIGGPSGGGQ